MLNFNAIIFFFWPIFYFPWRNGNNDTGHESEKIHLGKSKYLPKLENIMTQILKIKAVTRIKFEIFAARSLELSAHLVNCNFLLAVSACSQNVNSVQCCSDTNNRVFGLYYSILYPFYRLVSLFCSDFTLYLLYWIFILKDMLSMKIVTSQRIHRFEIKYSQYRKGPKVFFYSP